MVIGTPPGKPTPPTKPYRRLNAMSPGTFKANMPPTTPMKSSVKPARAAAPGAAAPGAAAPGPAAPGPVHAHRSASMQLYQESEAEAG